MMSNHFLALHHFFETAFQENWKYTNLARYGLDTFHNIQETTPLSDVVLSQIFKLLGIAPDVSQQTIFYNGRLLKNKITSQYLLTSLKALSPTFKLQQTNNRFKTFNEASYQDGAYLVIPKAQVIQDPIYIIHIIKSDDVSRMVHPRNYILLEEESEGTIIEITFILGEKASFTNSVTEVIVKENAKLHHLFLQKSLSQSLQIAHVNIEQSSNSHYSGTTVSLGGETNRISFYIDLMGSHALSQFYALNFVEKTQQADIDFSVNHEHPYSESTILSRGIIKDKGKGTFTGKIIVQKGAYQTKAFLENKNLLLSSEAEANARPQLEIYNNDVQCAHGATIGDLDIEALFYLKSRGIPEHEAKQLLIDSFLTPSLQGLSPSLQAHILRLIHEH